LTERTNREGKIPEIRRVASNSEAGKKEYRRRKIQSTCGQFRRDFRNAAGD
jgi:hypothetical protein